MHQHGASSSSTLLSAHFGVLVGNPNVGKSLLFKHLTGRYVTVSNYPGTTVEVAKGELTVEGHPYDLIDSPGTQSLLASSDDERVTRDLLLKGRPQWVILVADVKNLRRAFILLFQLASLEIPTVLALNMWDEARNRGIRIHRKKLEELFGIPVIPTIALHGKGIRELIAAISHARVPKIQISWHPAIRDAVESLIRLFPKSWKGKEGIALLFLGEDDGAEELLHMSLSPQDFQKALEIRESVAKRIPEPLSLALLTTWSRNAEALADAVRQLPDQTPTPTLGQHLDRWMTHPVWGYLFLALVLFLLYLFVGRFGAGTLVDWLENRVFNGFLNPWLTRVFQSLPLPDLVVQFFVGTYGIFTMALTYAIAIIFPIVLTFFIAFGILEDSGYLPRLAMLLDRFFKVMGLTGKAVLPMVLGLGCVTMATVTTRTLETKREKILVTLLLALGVPCSAQLGVVMAMMAGLSPAAYLVWGGAVLLNLLLVGFLGSRVLPGDQNYFILEIPPLRIPSLSNILWKTGARLEWYLKEVIPMFIIGTVILFVMDLSGLLQILERLFQPVVTGILGLPPQAAVGFIMGFLRRDYGAAGFLLLEQQGLLTVTQVIVSVVTITLFVPCIANALIMIRERGWKIALAIMSFILPYAIFVGWTTRMFLRLWTL